MNIPSTPVQNCVLEPVVVDKNTDFAANVITGSRGKLERRKSKIGNCNVLRPPSLVLPSNSGNQISPASSLRSIRSCKSVSS